MKIKSLHLKNFRCFEDFEIEFNTGDKEHGGLTVLVAKNGEGKTAILDAINIALGPFIGKMPKTAGAGFSVEDQTKHNGLSMGGVKLEADFLNNEVGELDLFHDDPTFSIVRELTSSKKKPTTTIKDASKLSDYSKYLFEHENEDIIWPLLAYYGDSRLWAAGRVTVEKKKALLKRERAYGYIWATEPQSGYREFEQWFADLSNAIWVSERQQRNKSILFKKEDLQWYCQLYSIIEHALKQALEITGWTKLEFDGDKQIMAINENTGDIVPWTSLSAGNRIVIGLVADIAHRCCILNSWTQNDVLKKTIGIVLIDEIELHLHPSWQQQILPTLQKIFPKIQFIVTTHSPQVVSSVPKECVRIIDSGEVIPFSIQTQGVESQDILAQIFGTDAAPVGDKFVQMLDEYAKLEAVNQADSEHGRRLRQKLIDHFGSQYGPLQRIEIHRRYFAKKQEK